MVAAEINDEIKPSEIFADEYKNQHSSSRKLNFYFEVNKIVRKSYYINHNKRWDDKYSINVIKRSYYFIYNDNNIYMSHNQYSPLSYNEHFTSNIKDINTFFTNFIELLIYIELLKQHIDLLNGNDLNNFLEFLNPILEKIKFLFNIDTDIDLIKKKYLEKDSYQDDDTPEKYNFVWSFSIDKERFNPIEKDIKTHLDLDETVESMLPAKFSIKKAEMEKFFTDAVAKKKTRCAKDPKSYNCRYGAPNLHQMYNILVGIAPTSTK